jgi:hypothetical protein
MSNSRSTKTISAETSAVVASADLLHWQGIFATFLKDASAALSRPHFYLIQANGWQSLCLLAGVSTSIYSQLLLKCKLVFIRTMSDGSRDVRLDREEWSAFMVRHGLGGNCGSESCVELTDARINVTAIERAASTNNQIEKVKKKMWVLRVGQIPAGERPPSNTAINNCQEPPRITRAMRQAKLCLINSTINLLIDESMILDVVAVEDWVLMRPTSTDVDHIAAGAKRKHEDDITLPSTPSIERPTDTASNNMPTYTMLIDDVSTDTHLHLDFPILSSLNPRLLHRGRRVVNGD